MIKISHEVPLCLLKDSLEFNKYQYALPHLLESNKEYLDHFIYCSNNNIEIYLDNSIHELGTAVDNSVLIEWACLLRPSNIFIPDVWENAEGSIRNAKEWINIKLPNITEKVAVVQAKNIEEARTCVLVYKYLGYKKIAFSYGASYYNEICPHPNKHVGKAVGRLWVITTLLNEGILDKNDRIHLLGTSIPQEISWYKNINIIESADTSNPIMAALENVPYEHYGLYDKPKANLNNYFNVSCDKINKETIEHNIKMFYLINDIYMNEDFKSLYDYLGSAAGSQLGKEVATQAKIKRIPVKTRYVSNLKFEGDVFLYPESFLNEYFKKEIESNDENSLPF
jgi:hypothetical protein